MRAVQAVNLDSPEKIASSGGLPQGSAAAQVLPENRKSFTAEGGGATRGTAKTVRTVEHSPPTARRGCDEDKLQDR
jgi:hypothetical protein